MIKFGPADLVEPVEKSTYVVQNVKPLCLIVDGINKEHNCMHM